MPPDQRLSNPPLLTAHRSETTANQLGLYFASVKQRGDQPKPELTMVWMDVEGDELVAAYEEARPDA